MTKNVCYDILPTLSPSFFGRQPTEYVNERMNFLVRFCSIAWKITEPIEPDRSIAITSISEWVRLHSIYTVDLKTSRPSVPILLENLTEFVRAAQV